MMMQAGCKGYLLKNADQQVLAKAIETVYNGEEYIEPGLKDQMFHQLMKLKGKPVLKFPVLTGREKQVLKFIAMELSNKEIADKLFISERTVENHRFNLTQKLEAKNTASLVKIAIGMGLVE